MTILNKKLWRDLWQAKGQVVAVIAVIACGIAVLGTVLSAYRNLKLSRDSYYHQYRFHDFSIHLEKAPLTGVFKIEEIRGVRAARGRIVKDVSLALKDQDKPKIGRMVSIPHHIEGIIDSIHQVKGRFLSAAVLDECLVNDKFFDTNHLKLGDRLTVTVNGSKRTLKVVGTAISPEYVYAIRNSQEMIPNPAQFAIVWVPQKWAENAFNMEASINEVIAEVYHPQQLEPIMDEAKKQLKPYGVYATVKRADQISNWYLNNEIEQLNNSARITPTIFLGVAALILLILLSRMVRREKNQIGLLKAYGYSNWQVAGHYFKFSLLIGVLGGILGFILGQWMGRGVIKMYVEFFAFPVLRYQFYPDLLLWSLGVSIFCALAGALAAIRGVLKIAPASAMRETPPRSAHQIFLEKIPPLWKRLRFSHKIIVRNIARYPLRSLFTVFGVILSTMILIVGYFSQDAMYYMLEHQFQEVQREDVRVTFYQERGIQALNEARRFPHVRRAEPMLLYPFEIRNGWKRKEIPITGIEPKKTELYQLLDTHEKPIKLGKGITLIDQTASELGVKPGDTVIAKPLMGKIDREYTLPVDQVVQQYIGAGAYMDLDRLSRLLNESRAVNAVLLSIEEEHIDPLNAYLKDVPAVAAVEIKRDTLKNFDETVSESMNIMNVVLILFAGVIAVAVIHNATVISIVERQREMASLRVLGFTQKEVGNLVFNENILLSVIGLILGLPVGAWACLMLTGAFVTDLFRFPFHIRQQTYLISAGLILAFVLLSNWFSRRRIAHLDMVAALKARE